mmetsp:Transcript_4409/g.8414  ORF Transcript_4409/g.8414 Transcript_4409/m.8414 type:complete len:931 (-) Transcript_4409:305-3097(-)
MDADILNFASKISLADFAPGSELDAQLQEEEQASQVQQVEELTDVQSQLLEYYKERIESFESERELFLDKLKFCDGYGAKSKELHQLKWQLHSRDQQVAELQKALSDAHVYLYDERELVLKLTAENDELRIQEQEDRKRIQHLLSLSQPLSQEVSYFRECRPDKITRSYMTAPHRFHDVPPSEQTNVGAPLLPADVATSSIPTGKKKQNQGKEEAGEAAETDTPLTASLDPRSWRGTAQPRITITEKGVATRDVTDKASSRGSQPRHRFAANAAMQRKSNANKTSSASTSPAHYHTNRHTPSQTNPARHSKSKGPKAASSSALAPSQAAAAAAAAANGPHRNIPHVVRTIYMPNESVDVLKLIIKSLRTQLEEQQALAEQRRIAMMEDRVIRETEHAERVHELESQLRLQDSQHKDMELLHQATTRDYLDIRHNSQATECELREQVEQLRSENTALRKAFADVKQHLANQARGLAKESEEYVSQFRTRTVSVEEELRIVRAQYKATQQLYETRIDQLSSKLASSNKKYRNLSKRREMDREGYAADIKQIRSQMAVLQKQVLSYSSTALASGQDSNSGWDLVEKNVIKYSNAVNNNKVSSKSMVPVRTKPKPLKRNGKGNSKGRHTLSADDKENLSSEEAAAAQAALASLKRTSTRPNTTFSPRSQDALSNNSHMYNVKLVVDEADSSNSSYSHHSSLTTSSSANDDSLRDQTATSGTSDQSDQTNRSIVSQPNTSHTHSTVSDKQVSSGSSQRLSPDSLLSSTTGGTLGLSRSTASSGTQPTSSQFTGNASSGVSHISASASASASSSMRSSFDAFQQTSSQASQASQPSQPSVPSSQLGDQMQSESVQSSDMEQSLKSSYNTSEVDQGQDDWQRPLSSPPTPPMAGVMSGLTAAGQAQRNPESDIRQIDALLAHLQQLVGKSQGTGATS